MRKITREEFDRLYKLGLELERDLERMRRWDSEHRKFEREAKVKKTVKSVRNKRRVHDQVVPKFKL